MIVVHGPGSLPPEVSACCEAYEKFYLTKHTGRKVSPAVHAR
jgi:hypothetical protein